MANYMHLTFEGRCKIEELLNKRLRKYQIAKEIEKTQSTISRELIVTNNFICIQITALIITVVSTLKIVKNAIINANFINLLFARTETYFTEHVIIVKR